MVDHIILKSIYFTDPNGIALEATYWVVDPTKIAADYSDSTIFGDPDPVASVKEKALEAGVG